MKKPHLKRNTRVDSYRVLEFVGQDDADSLYTAAQEGTSQLCWLRESNAPLKNLDDTRLKTFYVKGQNYSAFPVEGTSAAGLAKLVRTLDWKFIVPRWAMLAEQVGYFHSKGQLLQQGAAFDLDSILFREQARLLPLTFFKPSAAHLFRAPELADGPATPASDVFALGAALLYLLGGGSPELAQLKNGSSNGRIAAPRGLVRVLQKATDPDPLKRYRDASAFAAALYSVSPPIGSTAGAQPFSVIELLVVISLVLLILLVAAVIVGELVWGVTIQI